VSELQARTVSLWLLAALVAAGAASLAAAEPDGADAGNLLRRLAGVARLYSDAALRFACDETIVAEPGGTHRFEYIYVYGSDRKFRDYRTRPGSRSGREVDPAAAHLPRWLGQAYCWAFLFGEKRWSQFHYELRGDSEALGRPALLLRFEPVAPIEKNVNDWYGTAWIDRESAQILRVEAETPDDHGQRTKFLRRLAGGPAATAGPESNYFDFETVTTEFGFEKNGMRFPTEVTIERSRYTVPGRRGRLFDRTIVYRVRQTYDDYRFFSVRTADEIRSILSGGAEAPGAGLPVPPP
jgi:hypothetical protein